MEKRQVVATGIKTDQCLSYGNCNKVTKNKLDIKNALSEDLRSQNSLEKNLLKTHSMEREYKYLTFIVVPCMCFKSVQCQF